jgi:hypothetical protein
MKNLLLFVFAFAILIGCTKSNPVAPTVAGQADPNALGDCQIIITPPAGSGPPYRSITENITCAQCDSIAQWRKNNTAPEPACVLEEFTVYTKVKTY